MSLLKQIWRYWIKLGEILAWINTRVILLAIFYLVITPIGWCLKLAGKDLLRLKAKAKSYWLTPAGRLDKKQLTKQY